MPILKLMVGATTLSIKDYLRP